MSLQERSNAGRQRDEDDEDYAGHVQASSRRTHNTTTTTTTNTAGGSSHSVGGSTANRSQKTPLSWAVGGEYRVPIHNPDDASTFASLPPRLGTQKTNKRTRRGTPSSKASTTDYPDFSLPPEIHPHVEADKNSFKGWLASGALEALNMAAGVTLSTTELLLAPPLQLTKTMLLPGLLALFVDTFDAITPPRVQDWFRILTTSVHHLVSVLRSTERGNVFSTQFVVVVQDILQALSAPETRQVLVDGMAANIKFADALNTPEMKAWLEQLSILGCRLVDAAASGKSKQLMQDTKDLAWKGIEMATDPATTLALAEVTAHLCHALEDAQQSLNPTPRARRNDQNQSTYLNPVQMSDFPQQVSMEEVILSCLGEHNEGDGNANEIYASSIPSNVIWNEEIAGAESNYRDWKDRGDQVDVQLLKERILHNQRSKRKNPMSSAASSAKSSVSSAPPPFESLPIIISNDEGVNDNERTDTIGNAAEGSGSKQNDPIDGAEVVHETYVLEVEDMEDMAWDFSQKVKASKISNVERDMPRNHPTEIPPIAQFYRTLDDLLMQKRAEGHRRHAYEESTINNPTTATSGSSAEDLWKVGRAKVKKLRDGRTKQVRGAVPRRRQLSKFRQLPKKQQALVLFGAAVVCCIILIWTGFAFYGMLAFAKVHSHSKPPTTPGRMTARPLPNSEVVIRIVREVVHVREDGSIIETSKDSAVSEEDIEKVTECVASAFH